MKRIIYLLLVALAVLFFILIYFQLTILSLFDIIDNVDNVVIDYMTSNGLKNILNANKDVLTRLYIIYNKDSYINDIKPKNVILYKEDNTPCYTIGCIPINIYNDTYNMLFGKNESIADKDVELVVEPLEHISNDESKVDRVKISKNGYSIYYIYNRYINNIYNTYIIRYDFSWDKRIQNVTMLC